MLSEVPAMQSPIRGSYHALSEKVSTNLPIYHALRGLYHALRRPYHALIGPCHAFRGFYHAVIGPYHALRGSYHALKNIGMENYQVMMVTKLYFGRVYFNLDCAVAWKVALRGKKAPGSGTSKTCYFYWPTICNH